MSAGRFLSVGVVGVSAGAICSDCLLGSVFKLAVCRLDSVEAVCSSWLQAGILCTGCLQGGCLVGGVVLKNVSGVVVFRKVSESTASELLYQQVHTNNGINIKQNLP